MPHVQPAADAPCEVSPRLRAWSILWAILAVLHVTQAIWLSGGAARPGDLGDGRFNQLVLEHGYQSLHGVYPWRSPAQFYPAPDTLAYSDTHLGTLPIYAGLRWLGFDLESAYQAWFVVVAALNVVAGYRLFATLGIAGFLRGPVVFAAVASSTMVWLAGTHMQMLPLFPLLIAWTELLRWADDRRTSRLVAASGWFAWQFAAAPYLAFFGAIITAAVVAILFLGRSFGRTEETPAAQHASWRQGWLTAAVVAGVGWGLAIPVARIYLHAVDGGASRSMLEVGVFAPQVASWFRSNPLSLFYAGPKVEDVPFGVEQMWFAGILPWIATGVAFFAGLRARSSPTGRWMLALSGTALLTMLFFTHWSDARPGVWSTVAQHVEALRAFRSSGRIAALVQVLMVACAGLALAGGCFVVAPRWRQVPLCLACLLALETLSLHQPSTRLADARARSDAMIAEWKHAGDRPILAFAHGATNQSDVWLELDAWSAALRLKRATINGYSGGVPATHYRFHWHPTPKNARALLTDLAIPPERVSFVEHYSPENEARLGLEHYSDRPTQTLTDFDVQPFAWDLFAPLEYWVVEGVPMYQFTPDAEVRFRLPDRATGIEYLVGFRPDAYTNGGQTDGAGVTWLLAEPGQPERKLSYELIAPFTHPEHRGLLPRTLAVPLGHDRVLIFRSDAGPAHSQPWDFLLLGRLRLK